MSVVRAPHVTGMATNYEPRKVQENNVRRTTESLATGQRFELTVDVLECGHLLPEVDDTFGQRSPTRRRCTECIDGIPQLGRVIRTPITPIPSSSES